MPLASEKKSMRNMKSYNWRRARRWVLHGKKKIIWNVESRASPTFHVIQGEALSGNHWLVLSVICLTGQGGHFQPEVWNEEKGKGTLSESLLTPSSRVIESGLVCKCIRIKDFRNKGSKWERSWSEARQVGKIKCREKRWFEICY